MFRFNTPQQLSTDLSRLTDAKNMNKSVKRGPQNPDNKGTLKASKTNLFVKKVHATPRLQRFANLSHPWTVLKPHGH